MGKWWWKVQQSSRQLWVRTSCIGLLGILTALFAAVVESWIPWQLPAFVTVDSIESLLGIIASSMLAVTTFSLGIMTTAYGSASNGVTPRATKLLMEDSLTQTVLASFIGSFIFSIVGMIVLRFGAYGERGRVVLFVVTIAVIALIVINLLRWIDYLTRFGRTSETIGRVEQATQAALEQRLAAPFLGGQQWRSPCTLPPQALAVQAQQVGSVQHIDMAELQALAQAMQAQIYIAAVPGKHLFMDSALAWVVGAQATSHEEAQAWQDKVRSAFTVGESRNFEQDPRFGMAVMCEIASRALSPATNDPGTALDIISRITRLLSQWAQARQCQEQADTPQEVQYPALHVPALQSADLMDDAFTLMARDGAGLIEIQLCLQKSLAALARLGDSDFRQAARAQAQLAMVRAENGMALEADKQRLRELVLQLEAH